jgi:hypothetical protein
MKNMKNLYVLCIFITGFCFNLMGQSGQWRLNMYAALYNPESYTAQHQSGFRIDISVNNGNWTTIFQRTGTNEDMVTPSHAWNIRQIGPVNYQISDRINRIHVYTKIDHSGGGDPDQGWKEVTFQTASEKIKYKNTHYEYGAVYFSWQGYLDVYAYPYNVNVVLRSPVETGVSAEDKVKIEAPAGYDPEVYRWVYKKNLYDSNEAWKPVANSSLIGNAILEATLADIYGPGFMDDGVVDFCSNTYIALEFDIYQDKNNPRVKGYSNTITVPNKLIAPKIVSAVGGKTQCPGESNGTIKVTFDRPLLSNEIISFQATLTSEPGIEGRQRDSKPIDATTYEIYNLAAGTYTVKITSRVQCPAGDYSANSTGPDFMREGIVVTEADPVIYTVNEADKNDISCKGDNSGSFKVTAGGGTAPYTLWFEPDDTGGFIAIPDNKLEVTGLKAGSYRYYVTDLYNCQLDDPEYGGPLYKTVTLTEPAESLAVSLMQDKTADPSGKGRSDGYITVKITGGTAPYTAVWKEKTSATVLTTVDSSIAGESKLYNIPAGTYSVMVTDSKGCMLSVPFDFTLLEPDALRVTINQEGQVLCYGDASVNLTVSVSGGSGGLYTYIWSKKVNGIYEEVSTSSSLYNQGAGDYKVLVSDGNTPPNVQEMEYSISGPMEFTAGVTKVDVGCKNASTGSITFAISGGVAPYNIFYRESSEFNYTKLTANNTSYSITNLKAGIYDYYLTDANGCSAQMGTGTSGKVTITEPYIAINIVSSEIKNPSGAERNDGSITIKIEGGTPFTAGNPYIIIWKNESGTVIPSNISVDGAGVVTSALINLIKGTYSVEVSDNSACTVNAGYNLTGPAPLSVTLDETKHIDCFGNKTAQITAHAMGGIPLSSGSPYTYKWYKVESGNEILISGENGDILNNLGIGVYKVKITDGSTPPNTAESSSITVSQPASLEASVVLTKNISCFGGSDGVINISVTGGAGEYQLFYKLNTVDMNFKPLPVTLPDKIFYLKNIPAGKYSLYIKDANGCLASIEGRDTTEIVLTEPDKPIMIVAQQLNTPSGQGRSDGSITITMDGGTPFDSENKYLITWKDGNGNVFVPENGLDAKGLFTSKISNLAKGDYSVEIKDKNYQDLNNGCFISTVITLKDPPPLYVSLENTKTIKCFGDNAGELVAHAGGGVPYLTGIPYTYAWYRVENDVTTLIENATDSVLSNIPAGFYKVKVMDGSSVTNSVESGVYEISQPEKLVATVDTRMILCYQGRDGYIHLSASGGTGSYKLFYELKGTDVDYHEITDNINGAFNLDNLPAGVYSLYILDENSCHASIKGTDIAEIELTQPGKALTVVSDTVYDPSGYGLFNGEIYIQVDGGTPEYTVIWRDSKGNVLTAADSSTDGVFTSVLTGLSEGKYSVEVRDANYFKADKSNNTACTVIKEYELIQPEELTLELEETHYISCYQMSDGEITAHVKGGVKSKDGSQSSYKYTWYREENGVFVVMPDRKDGVLTGIPAGVYQLVVEDYARIPNKISATLQIVQPELLTATSEDVRVACGEVADISVKISGGTLPYTCKWNTGDTTPYVEGLAAGKYMVIVTDAHGCEVSAIAKVISPSDLSVSGETSDPVCYQATNGSITIHVSGGTVPYAYQWSTGKTTKDLTNIGAGIYTVTVTDKDGCSYSESFELIDPEPAKVDLGEDIILCVGQTYTLEPKVKDPKTTFNWTGPGGFKSTDSKAELNRAGIYQLTITDSKGCQATDQVEVFSTDYGISAEMVVASDVFVNDTIILINISTPEPDRIEWLFNEKDPVQIIETTSEYALIIYKQTGNYSVGMRSFVQDCYQDVVKVLNVTASDGSINDNFGQTDIISFAIYPNPNDGKFTIKVELGRQSTIRLRLFSLVHGGVMDDRTLSGSKLYEEQYQLYLSPGVYVLLLETASGRRSQKIIIK